VDGLYRLLMSDGSLREAYIPFYGFLPGLLSPVPIALPAGIPLLALFLRPEIPAGLAV
jgi:hypothetical protein